MTLLTKLKIPDSDIAFSVRIRYDGAVQEGGYDCRVFGVDSGGRKSLFMKYPVGFDNEKYLQMQTQRILERVDSFGGKLYMEFGGKLFDDYHASRVLPGFEPDSKMQMLLKIRDEAEIVIAINANDIEKTKSAATSVYPTIWRCCA